jgi:hypothetical protein
MKINREWATPLAFGSFFLSAVTGVLIFFHIDTGFNKEAHEWLSWVLLAGVLFHSIANLPSLKKYFSKRNAQIIVGLFVILLGLSFINLEEDNKPPYFNTIKALSDSSLENVAIIAKITPEETIKRLSKAGFQVTSSKQKVSEIVGDDFRKQMSALNSILVNEN